MKSISDLIFSKLISFEPNINPVQEKKSLIFLQKSKDLYEKTILNF